MGILSDVTLRTELHSGLAFVLPWEQVVFHGMVQTYKENTAEMKNTNLFLSLILLSVHIEWIAKPWQAALFHATKIMLGIYTWNQLLSLNSESIHSQVSKDRAGKHISPIMCSTVLQLVLQNRRKLGRYCESFLSSTSLILSITFLLLRIISPQSLSCIAWSWFSSPYDSRFYLHYLRTGLIFYWYLTVHVLFISQSLGIYNYSGADDMLWNKPLFKTIILSLAKTQSIQPEYWVKIIEK